MAKETIRKVPYMSMGSDLLNLLVGGDKGVMGLPYGSILNVVGDKSSGKAQPLYSKVLTPSGWKTMGDMQVGTEVCTPFRGETAKVLAVFPQGKRDTYRFHFNDGTTVDSADNHYWVMQSPNQYSSAHKSALGAARGQFLVTTKELAELYKDGTPASADVMALPLIDPVEYTAAAPKGKIPPYLMGLLLSEGGLTSGTPIISNPEPDIIEKAAKDAKKIGMELHQKSGHDGIMYSITLAETESGRSWLPEYIRELGLDCKSTDKHIPSVYLYASVEDRIDLLHGLFDGDGWISKNGAATYSTSSKALAEDIAELVRSLGLRATVSAPHTPFYMREGKRQYCTDSYRIYIVGGGILPFSSEKHAAAWAERSSGKAYIKQRRVLQSVEYLGKIECQCIYLDHPRHLYITDNFIPTHNTFVKNEVLAANYHASQGDPKKFAWFSDDCESGDTFDTMRLYGMETRPRDKDGYLRIGNKKVEDSATVEDMDAHVSLMLEYMDTLPETAVGIYAIDSLDGLSDASKEAMEGARLGQIKSGKDVEDKGNYGMQIPKFLSQNFFRTKHKKLEDAHCSLIIISQIRDKIDSMGYGQKWEVSCGKALEFYCHTRIFLQTVRKIERDGLVVGAYVKATTFKSKTPRPYRTVFYTVYFDYGIDNIGSNLDYLYDLREKDGKLNGNASAIKWEGGADLSLQAMKDWMTETGCLAACRAARKAQDGNSNISMEFAKGWIAKQPELMAKFEEKFGKQYTRDELIRMCDNDPAMNAELTRRVIEKWEAHEDAVMTVRPRKYGAPAQSPGPAMDPTPNPPVAAPAADGESWQAPNEEAEETPDSGA